MHSPSVSTPTYRLALLLTQLASSSIDGVWGRWEPYTQSAHRGAFGERPVQDLLGMLVWSRDISQCNLMDHFSPSMLYNCTSRACYITNKQIKRTVPYLAFGVSEPYLPAFVILLCGIVIHNRANGLGKWRQVQIHHDLRDHCHQQQTPDEFRSMYSMLVDEQISHARKNQTTKSHCSVLYRKAFGHLFSICIQVGGTVEIQRSSGGRSVRKTGMAFASTCDVYSLEHDLWICVHPPARLQKAPKIRVIEGIHSLKQASSKRVLQKLNMIMTAYGWVDASRPKCDFDNEY